MIVGSIVALLLAALATGAGFWRPRRLLSWLSRRSSVLFVVETRAPVVALTIDDGPHPELTPAFLDVLRRHQAKATFFVIGERVAGNEHLLERIRAEGHEIGNHLHTDRPSVLLPRHEFERQLLAVDRLLGPSASRWFRPGSGWFSRPMLRIARRHAYRCCLATALPVDARLRHSGLIERLMLRALAPGSILVLHDGSANRYRSVQVLESLLPKIRARGFEVRTVSELVALATATAANMPANMPV